MNSKPMPATPRELARYGVTAQLAHWLTAVLLVGIFTLGFYMVECDHLEHAIETAKELGKVNPGGAYEIRPVSVFRPDGLR